VNSEPQITTWDLRDAEGCGPTLINLGATIVALSVPDADGRLSNVVLGLPHPDAYLQSRYYLGCVVGRYANRIAQGRFSLDGQHFQLPINNGPNTLHGGHRGFNKRFWLGEHLIHPNGKGVRLSLISPEGDQGFPGDVEATTSYVWTDDKRLSITFDATASKPTPFNITQHSYWNLGGEDSNRTILDHQLCVEADAYLPVDERLIPTGALMPVAGTPFDFRSKKPIGRDIGMADVQLDRANGYDHCWVLNGGGLRRVAELSHAGSGRRMIVETDQPGLQVYSGNGFGGDSRDAIYPQYGGVALETQHFPDSPNQPNFPDTILRPGQRFRSQTIFSFSVG
jgi:aldose 1-epimerase